MGRGGHGGGVCCHLGGLGPTTSTPKCRCRVWGAQNFSCAQAKMPPPSTRGGHPARCQSPIWVRGLPGLCAGHPKPPGWQQTPLIFFSPPPAAREPAPQPRGGGWRPWRRGLLASNAPRVATGLILQQRPQKLHSQAPGVVENVPVAFCRAVHLPKKLAVGHPPGAGHGPGGRSNFKFGPQLCKPQAPGVAAKGHTGLVWWARPILCPFARICWPANGQGGPLAPFGQIWRPEGHSCPPSGPQAPKK